MVEIFGEKTFKEFQELYQILIPSLSKCGNCNMLHCSYCKCIDCFNCKKFKEAKWCLFKKCSSKQWNYIINFLRDFLSVSSATVYFFSDLKPVSEHVRSKNRFFVYF